MKAIQITVFGRVQGVGFRYATHQKANELDIKGFVTNQLDGSVFIEAEGEDKILNQFTEWCKKGPTWAYVKNYNIIETTVKNYTNFSIE